MTRLHPPRWHHLLNQGHRRDPKVPLRLVLTLPFVLLTVGTTGLVGYLCIRNGQQAVADLAHQLMTETGDRVNLYLSNYLETPQLVNRFNANAVRLGQLDITNPERLKRHFIQQIQTLDSLSHVHFSNPQGGYVSAGSDERGLSIATTDNFVKGTLQVYTVDQQGNRRELLVERPNYDASQRPFYQRAIEAGQPVWTPIYVYVPASRGLGISASYPLYDEKQRLQGVLSSDLTLVAIHQFLEKLRVGTNGTVFIVDRSGLMVASSTSENPFFTSADNRTEQLKAIDSQELPIRASTQHLIAQFGDLSQVNTAAQLQFNLEGEPQFLQVMPFKDEFGLDWLIVVTVPETDFLGRIALNTRTTVLLSLGALLGAIALGLWLSRSIVRPIQRLGQASLALAEGEWDKTLKQNSSIAELQVLNTSFDRMAIQLQQSFDRVKTALQESEEKFTQVFRTCPDPISIVTLEGRYLDINDAFVDLFGYAKEEVIGRKAAEVEHWVNPEERQRYVQLVQSGQSVRNLEFSLRNKLGQLLTVLFSSDSIELQGQLYRVGIAKNITDRKSAELALQQQKELRETIYNEATDATFLVDPETLLILDCNRRAVELFEANSKAELIGIEGRTLQRRPFTSAEVEQIVAEMDEKGVWSREIEYVTRTGKVFWGNLAAKSIQLASQPVHLVRVTDINSRKQAEEALRQNEARFQRLAAAAPGAIYTLVKRLDQSFYFEYVSPAIEEINELTVEQMLSNPEINLIHPADWAGYEAAVARSALTLTAFSHEFRIITPSGKLKWLQASSRPEQRENGDIAWYGIVLDVSDRKQTELELIESRDLREAIFDASADAILLVESPPHLRILDCNQRAVELFEAESKAELIGIESNRFKRQPLTQADVAEITLAMQEIGLWSREMEYVTKTGKTFWGNLAIKPIQIANQAIWLVRVTDISARKHIEEALRQSEQLFRGAFETSAFGISIRSPEGKYLRVNQALCHILGYSESELLQLSYRDITHPDDLAIDLANTTHKLLAGEVPYYYLEKRFIHKDGQIIWGLISISLVRDLQQQPLYLVAQVQNITERKQAEVERKQAEAERQKIEEALRQSEARFQKIAAASPAQIYILTCQPDGFQMRYEYISPGVREIQELEPEQVLENALSTYEQVHPDDRQLYSEAAYRSSQTLEPFSYEWRIITPSGKLKWVQANSRPERQANGEIVWYGVLLDVTERKMAEEALRQSEERNRAILSAIPDLMKLYSVDGIYLDTIKSNSTFDLISDDETLFGKHISELIPPDIAAMQLQLMQQAVETGEVQVYEQQVWFQETLQYEEVRIVPCSQNAALLLIRNITDRKQAEEALRRSEAALRRAQQVAHIGSWEVDVETEQIIWSEESFHIFGWDVTHPEPTLFQFYGLVHPDDRFALQQAVSHTMANGGSYKTEFRVIQPQGVLRYVEARAEAIRNENGQVVQLLGTNLDITERQQAEAALRQSEATKKQILKAIPDLIIWMSADGTCIDMIEGGNVTNLYVKSEVIGKNLYDWLPADLAQARRNAVQEVLRIGEVQIYEQQVLIQDEICYEEVRVIGVGGDRILVIVRDITERKRAEGERKRAEAALMDSETRFRSAFQDAPIGMALIGLDNRWIKINPMLCDMLGFSEFELLSMTASSLVHPNDIDKLQQCIQQVLSSENRNAQVELRYCCQQGRLAWGLLSLSLVRDAQAQPLYYVAQIQDITERQAIDRMKNEFISIVSHELRTPLTVIRGFLGLLDTGMYNNKPDKAKHMIEQALINSDRLVRLVNDILDLERLSSGRAQFIMETCDAQTLLQQAAAGVQSLADQASVALVTVPTASQVWADPDSIIQTLTNLLSNAIKFSPPSSVVTLSAQAESEWVLFSVSDQGRGIPTEKLETIFGRFQQVDVSDSRQKGGTGLGLAICQSIVQQHGGNIWVESTFGEGSTFYFTLPLSPSQEQGQAHP